MKTIIQVTAISGNIIEEANWELEFGIPPTDSHEVSLNFESQDVKLLSLLNANERNGLVIDGDVENGFNLSMKFDVKKIKHIVDISTKEVKTFIILSPVNRTLEQILLYLINPRYCNHNFLKMIKY